MDVPGRWAGGFRAWDEHGVYLATGRGVTAGRVLRVPAEVLRERSNAWFPFGGHLIRGPLPHRALHRVDGPAARVARHPGHARRRPRARDQQPGRRRHPGGRRPRDRVCRRCSPPEAGWPATRSRPSSSPRSTRCAGRSSRRAADPDPLARADREQALVALAGRPRRRARLGHRPAAGRRRRRSRLVRAGRGRPGRTGPRAGPGVGGEHLLGGHAAGGGEGVDAAHLRARRAPCAPTRSWTVRRCSRSR